MLDSRGSEYIFITLDKQILTVLSAPVVELDPMSQMPNLIAVQVDTERIFLDKSDCFLEVNSVFKSLCNIVLMFLLIPRKLIVKNFGFKIIVCQAEYINDTFLEQHWYQWQY